MRSLAYRLSLLLPLLLLIAACDAGGGNENGNQETCQPETFPFLNALEQQGDVGVHDPVIIKHDESYVLFYTGPGVQMKRSEDLIQWVNTGQVFDQLPNWATREIPGVQFPWAPDVSFYDDQYHLYYSLSTFGSQRSAIGLATNATLDPESPDYAWIDQGKVIESAPGEVDYNAIDPNVAFDENGQPWLAWGSYWGGIKMRRLDAETGLPSDTDTTLYSLAARPEEDAIEAPFIVRHEGYYYLFVSWDQCCNGAQSTYKIMVGRSENITGPYVDRSGTPMMEGGGTLVLASHGRIRGPGHNAVLTEDGRHYLVHHFYDAQQGGASKLQIRALVWGEDGWPLAGVSYDGADDFPSDGATPDVAGRWAHSVDFTQPVEIQLLADGGIERCGNNGEWSLGDSFLTLQWPLDSGSGDSWVARNVIGPNGTWYVGRDQNGYVVRGRKVNAE